MNNKKKVSLLASLSLVGVLAVGGTLALFTANTDELTNTFTAGKGISIELKEPNWDGISFAGETFTKPAVLGKDTAKEFAPADVIAKNPTIKNTSTKEDIFAGLTLAYSGQTLTEIQKFADIDFNTTDWTFNADYTKAYCKNAVTPNEKTKPVFNSVTIKADAKAETIKGFEIVVDGYGVQAEGANAETVLKGAFAELK